MFITPKGKNTSMVHSYRRMMVMAVKILSQVSKNPSAESYLCWGSRIWCCWVSKTLRTRYPRYSNKQPRMQDQCGIRDCQISPLPYVIKSKELDGFKASSTLCFFIFLLPISSTGILIVHQNLVEYVAYLSLRSYSFATRRDYCGQQCVSMTLISISLFSLSIYNFDRSFLIWLRLSSW